MKTGKEERGLKPKKHKELHKTTAYHPLVPPISIPPATPAVHVLSRAFFGMEYPFDQLGSAILAMLPHSFLWTFSLAEYGTLKNLCCRANTT